MDGLQSVLSQVPTIGVYVLGAAAVAAFGLTGSVGAGTIAPGATLCQRLRIGLCMH